MVIEEVDSEYSECDSQTPTYQNLFESSNHFHCSISQSSSSLLTLPRRLRNRYVNHFFTLSIFSIAYQIVNSFECSHTSIFVFTNWNQQQIQYFLLMNDWTYFRRLLLSIHISSRTNNIHNTLNRFSINSRSVAVSGSRLLHRDNKTRKRSKIS